MRIRHRPRKRRASASTLPFDATRERPSTTGKEHCCKRPTHHARELGRCHRRRIDIRSLLLDFISFTIKEKKKKRNINVNQFQPLMYLTDLSRINFNKFAIKDKAVRRKFNYDFAMCRFYGIPPSYYGCTSKSLYPCQHPEAGRVTRATRLRTKIGASHPPCNDRKPHFVTE
ncbi:hypothetical protein PUN28_013706 [Cardiocondyla obscurior]|uniref:Uncharacterized protein n=1 Tax=Cardiocondyla obscurior TaxID=286306 RepID=A0AAW2F6P9_9HYME